jgi:hypothetical protein
MDDFKYENYCIKCIDDHEERLRVIEANNKEQAKLYYEREKLDLKIDGVQKYLDTRIDTLEKWKDLRMAELITEKSNKVEGKHDVYSIISMIVSIGTFVILIVKVTL